MKKIVLMFITILLILTGCNKDSKDKDDDVIDKELESSYLELSKSFNSNIHSNKTFEELATVFDSKKDKITEEVYENNFNMSKLSNQNSFAFGYDVLQHDVEGIYLERLSSGEVNIVIINKINMQYESFEDGDHVHDLPLDVFVTNVYSFKDGKLTEFNQYY